MLDKTTTIGHYVGYLPPTTDVGLAKKFQTNSNLRAASWIVACGVLGAPEHPAPLVPRRHDQGVGDPGRPVPLDVQAYLDEQAKAKEGA